MYNQIICRHGEKVSLSVNLNVIKSENKRIQIDWFKQTQGAITVITKFRNKASVEIIPNFARDFSNYFARVYYGWHYEHLATSDNIKLSPMLYNAPYQTSANIGEFRWELNLFKSEMNECYIRLGEITKLNLPVESRIEKSFYQNEVKIEWHKCKEGTDYLIKSDIEEMIDIGPMEEEHYGTYYAAVYCCGSFLMTGTLELKKPRTEYYLVCSSSVITSNHAVGAKPTSQPEEFPYLCQK